jgi:hypothetical protein
MLNQANSLSLPILCKTRKNVQNKMWTSSLRRYILFVFATMASALLHHQAKYCVRAPISGSVELGGIGMRQRQLGLRPARPRTWQCPCRRSSCRPGQRWRAPWTWGWGHRAIWENRQRFCTSSQPPFQPRLAGVSRGGMLWYILELTWRLRSPTSSSASCSRASSLCPTSSKASVASWPARSNMTSSPPLDNVV